MEKVIYYDEKSLAVLRRQLLNDSPIIQYLIHAGLPPVNAYTATRSDNVDSRGAKAEHGAR